MANKIESGYKDKLETEVVKDIIKIIQENKNNSNTTLSESIPVVIQKVLGDSQLLGGQHDWNWRNDYKSIINSILNKYPEIKAEYEQNLKKIVEMSQNGNLTEIQIRQIANEMANNLKNKLPNKEEVNKIIKETEQISSGLKNIAESFNREEFRSNIKQLIDNFKSNKMAFLIWAFTLVYYFAYFISSLYFIISHN